jgi:phosphosulfolactate synthase
VRSGLVEEIAAKVDPSAIIFEAPLKAQQAWLVKKFGTEASLGNIAPHDILGLETLRLGLRADSMPHFHDVDAWNQGQDTERELRIVPKRQFVG